MMLEEKRGSRFQLDYELNNYSKSPVVSVN